jgi:hypothetical protein
MQHMLAFKTSAADMGKWLLLSEVNHYSTRLVLHYGQQLLMPESSEYTKILCQRTRSTYAFLLSSLLGIEFNEKYYDSRGWTFMLP